VSLPVRISTIRALIKEINVSADADKPLIVGGARSLAPELRKQLGLAAGGADRPEGAAVYVHILGGDDDEAALRRARSARVPIVALAPETVDSVPHVLATDIVRLRSGAGFPVEALCETIAGRLGEEAAPLAARVPVLRRAVGEQLVDSFARRNGLIGAAVFIGGVDLPVLVRNQLRMVLRLEQAYGLDVDLRERVVEIAGTIGLGVGFRAIAREIVRSIPIAGWAVQGGVAYAGTRALGEAALMRLERGTPGRH
jgi:uncharacterized protein (DUF697 family)